MHFRVDKRLFEVLHCLPVEEEKKERMAGYLMNGVTNSHLHSAHRVSAAQKLSSKAFLGTNVDHMRNERGRRLAPDLRIGSSLSARGFHFSTDFERENLPFLFDLRVIEPHLYSPIVWHKCLRERGNMKMKPI